MNTPLTLADIRAAHARIVDKIHRTPVLTSATLDALCGGQLFFKCENFQKIGAFKARGAANAVFALTDAEAARGVATHSSGNHAAALARAARLRSIPAHIVMPSNAPKTKIESVRRNGGRIIFCEPNVVAREAACAQVIAETGARLIHPYNDYAVMAGQGTATLEFLEQAPELDLIIVPVGGGGLLCGTAVAAKGVRPDIRVIAAEPAGADDAARSFAAGRIIPLEKASTVADGLRTSLGERNFPLIQQHVDGIVTVLEDSIVAAMRRIWEVLKIIIEPSCAVPYAAIMEQKINVSGKRVGIILTGGNVDLDALPWLAK
ncbi:MAG: serine dehydratase [Opitutia bacterium]|nr:pyridoxal-phosphate dependent enzyme [Opitutaceae bacterium]PHX86313.1 MAG: serine dehydratase [Opitutae bacterium]